MALNWDAVYEIATELRRLHPRMDLLQVTLADVFAWTTALPEFEDDPALCNDEILASILQEWYEVTIHD
jgi:FeS assembly protein IscX